MPEVDTLRQGSRVRIVSTHRWGGYGSVGTVLFISGDDITVIVDGYMASNTFNRSELEEIPNG